MSDTPRDIVRAALRFESPSRIPRDLWVLPWAHERLAEGVAQLQRDWPGDIVGAPGVAAPSARVQGDPYTVGTYVDEWGCRFTNLQRGIIGEVHDPIVSDLADWRAVKPPYDTLPHDRAAARDCVNRFCAGEKRFVLSPCLARPWERYQFLRGTENAMVDAIEGSAEFGALLNAIHAFYVQEIELWSQTDVDAVFFMDDWGAQQSLLISPDLWRTWFKPLYAEYSAIAHAHGKFAFMHSDGHISSIYEDLIEVGVDALNSQLFCMDIADLEARAKGRITFWGEIDRQHVMPAPDPNVGREAVRRVARHLYDPRGGLIAQFELGAGANIRTAWAIYDEWSRV